MKIAKYWVRENGHALTNDGGKFDLTVRGWSNENIEAARATARQSIKRIAAMFESGMTPKNRYLYGDRPLPEPILHEFSDGREGPIAAVTRNAYGAQILNTRDLMFVDIDREDAPPSAGVASGLISSVLSLFGKPASAPASAPPQDPVLRDIERVATGNRLVARVYKTAAGYRALIVNAKFEAGSEQSEAILKQFASDPLYVRLCRIQNSFRARLTPKPWRCGLKMLRVSFPFDGPRDEANFKDWKMKYDAASSRYATCKYLASVGGGGIDPAFEELVAYHDAQTKAMSGMPLA